MSDPVPEKKEAPSPVAPPFGELLELSLTALVNAPGVFARLAARPAPRPVDTLLVALIWGAAFFALNLIRSVIANPAALQTYAPRSIVAVGVLGLILWAALFLLGASFVYGLGRALGRAGDFDRALLVAAVMLAAAPVQALCGWWKAAWVLPTAVAAWTLACGLNALFKANLWTARGVCAALAAGVLALQYGAGLAVEKYSAAARLAAIAAQSAPSANQLIELQQQLQQVQNPQPGPSSLDLLSALGDSSAPREEADTGHPPSEISSSGEAMKKSVVNMLDAMAPMLDNPAITRNMTIQQKADYAELKKMIQDMKNGMAANTLISPQEQQAQMIKIQQLMMRLIGAEKK